MGTTATFATPQRCKRKRGLSRFGRRVNGKSSRTREISRAWQYLTPLSLSSCTRPATGRGSVQDDLIIALRPSRRRYFAVSGVHGGRPVDDVDRGRPHFGGAQRHGWHLEPGA